MNRTRRTVASRIALGLLIWTAAVACPGVENLNAVSGRTGGSGTVGTGGGGTTAGSSALVGQWSRSVYVSDADGNLHESRTVWEFRADGSAIRTTTAWNITQGIADTTVTVAQWSASGGTLTITYVTPAGGTTSYAYGIVLDTLTIGPEQYTRVR